MQKDDFGDREKRVAFATPAELEPTTEQKVMTPKLASQFICSKSEKVLKDVLDEESLDPLTTERILTKYRKGVKDTLNLQEFPYVKR